MLWTRDRFAWVMTALLAVASLLGGTSKPALAYQEDVLFLGHAASRLSELSTPDRDGLLVRRDNGTPYLLTVGDGCQDLPEGRRITLRDMEQSGVVRGVVEDVGSSISCPLFECRAVQLLADGPSPDVTSPGLDATSTDISHVVTALQRALQILGYEPGKVDGEVGPSTAAALMQYRSDKRHDVSGQDLRFTLWTLGMDVLVAAPGDAAILPIADTLLGVADE